ncbi:MAG: hypothetical protein ABH872_06520 [Candidatus Omnitrophota bacterium]
MKNLFKFKNQVIAVVIIAAAAFTIKNIIVDYSAKMQQEDKRSQEIAYKKAAIEQWNKVQGQYADKKKEFLRSNELEFQNFVKSKAGDYGLSIVSLTPSKIQEQGYAEASLRLRFSCAYNTVVNFTRALEEQRVQAEAMSIVNESPNVRVDLLLKDFFVTEK